LSHDGYPVATRSLVVKGRIAIRDAVGNAERYSR
jgi:hypothetical protein